MKKFLNQRGFSLVELLVVITIIMILVALAAPIYNGTMQKAREAAHDSNVRVLTGAATMFILDNPRTAAIWAPEAGQVAGETVSGTHEAWYPYLTEWPENPFDVGYVVEIDKVGGVVVSPGKGVYE